MCQNVASHAESGIVIRHYRPQDLAQMKALFGAGMMSNVDTAIRQAVVLPGNLLTLSFWTGAVAKYTKSVVWPVVALPIPVLALYQMLRRGFGGYIQKSIDDDLSKIDEVYIKPGGCFLVAVPTDDESVVVGMVAGEKKDEDVYELRRMSVQKTAQGQGIGKLLIQGLEKEFGSGKMILSTASSLLAAQKLYAKNGFKLIRKMAMNAGWLTFFVPLEIYFYEKDF